MRPSVNVPAERLSSSERQISSEGETNETQAGKEKRERGEAIKGSSVAPRIDGIGHSFRARHDKRRRMGMQTPPRRVSGEARRGETRRKKEERREGDESLKRWGRQEHHAERGASM